MDPAANSHRTILFLQGPPSGFWSQLAQSFERAGARTLKVHFCLADSLFWRRGNALSYRGRRKNWASWLARLIQANAITDIIYYADRMPYHADAADVAVKLGVNAFCVEFGYLRPGWLTLERGGMGAFSHFPGDLAAIREISEKAGQVALSSPYRHTFAREAIAEVSFNIANLYGIALYPFYAPERLYWPVTEYLSTLLRSARRLRRKKRAMETLARAYCGAWPFFIYALQLQSDWQIRANSPFPDQTDVLRAIIASFARNAPIEARLIVKLHPMDVGMIDWGARTDALAQQYGVGERVHFVDGGDLERMLANTHGVLVSNSTVGLHAIRAGRPVKTFGAAIYDLSGLTHQGPLDTFWTAPEPVDVAFAQAFVQAIAGTIQLPGSFYDTAGRKAASQEIARRVLLGEVNELGAFKAPPPRLNRLRQPSHSQVSI